MSLFPNGVLFGPEGEQYNTYSAERYQLGTMLRLRDGRVFRFARMGATVGVAGSLYQAALPIANHQNRTPVAAAVDAVTVNVAFGATAGAANLYQYGYLYVDTDPGGSYVYKIDSHPAIAGSDSQDITLSPDTKIKVALTTTSRVSLVHNKWRSVLIHASPATAALAGVAVRAITASEWGWLQTGGSCGVLTQGTLVIGDTCIPSASVDGAVAPNAADTAHNIGYVQRVAADTLFSMVFLTIDS